MENDPRQARLVIESDLHHLKKVETFSKKIAAEMDLSRDKRDNLSIAITEAVGNAIIHGNKSNPEKKVTIEIAMHPEKIVITVTDEGEGFDPQELDDPLDPANLMKESGRGIFIMTALLDEIKHTFDGNGTTVTMTLLKDDTQS